MRNLTCAECGAGYTVEHNRKSCFCSDLCRWRANEAKRSRKGRTRGESICDWCGHTYQRTGHYQKACSLSCSSGLRWVGRSVPIKWRTCQNCGVWYTPKSGRRCDCNAYGYVPRGTVVTAECRTCGEDFVFEVSTNYQRFCSEECRRHSPAVRRNRRAAKRRRKAQRRGLPYDRYDSRDIFDRDGWVCRLCLKPVRRGAVVPHPLAPTIDHIVPLARGGGDTRVNVQCAHFECNWRKSDYGISQLRLIG